MSASLDDNEITATLIASDVMSAISGIGSLFILVCYFRYSNLRRFAFTLVAILSFTDVLNQVTEFIQPSVQELDEIKRTGVLTPACWAQALTDSYFELASVLWTSAIAATLWLVVFYRLDQTQLYAKLKWMAAICYGIPAVLALLPIADNAYGVAGAWCWIPSTTRSRQNAAGDTSGSNSGVGKWVWQWIVFYVPLMIAITFNTVVYVRTYALLQRTIRTAGENDSSAQALRGVMRRLQLYPVVLAVIWLPAIVNRAYETATGNQVFALYFIQKVFSSSQGLWNACIYGLSQGVREAITEDLARMFPKYFTDPTIANASDLLQRETSMSTKGGHGDKAPLRPHGGAESPGSGLSSTVLSPASGVLARNAAALQAQAEEDDDGDLAVVVPPPRASLPSLDVHVGRGGGAALDGSSAVGPPAVRIVSNPVAGVVPARQDRVQAMYGQGGPAET